MKHFNFSALDWMRRVAIATVIFALPFNAESAEDDISAPSANFKLVRANPRLQPVYHPSFDQLVFGHNQDEAKIRGELGKFLSDRIVSLDAQCHLSEEQRQKLLLAGIGDLKRVFDRVDELRRDYETLSSTEQWDQLARLSAFRMQPVVNSGFSVFGREALLTKAIRHVLTDDQRLKYDEMRLTRRAARIRPNPISFGEIRTGAIVEASCHITIESAVIGNVEVMVDAPSFLQNVQTHVDLQNGQGRNPPGVDINISLCTSTLGGFEGTIRILIGDEWFAEIPIAASILANEPGLRRILMVEGPFSGFSSNDALSLDAWLGFVNSAKLDPSYLAVKNGGSVLRELNLSKYDVIVMGETGLLFLNQHDNDRLKNFVEAGGRLIVTTNSEFRGTIAKANQFLTAYGLRIEDKGVPSGRFVPVECLKMAAHPLTKGVGKLTLIGPSAISIEDAIDALILVNAPGFPEAGHAAIVKAGKGSVVVLGSSACWSLVGGDKRNDSDNALFLKNLICQPYP